MSFYAFLVNSRTFRNSRWGPLRVFMPFLFPYSVIFVIFVILIGALSSFYAFLVNSHNSRNFRNSRWGPLRVFMPFW